MFQGNSTGDYRKFHACFKQVLRGCLEHFMGVSKKAEGCLKSVLGCFKSVLGCFKNVFRVIKGSFKSVSRIIGFNGVLTLIISINLTLIISVLPIFTQWDGFS